MDETFEEDDLLLARAASGHVAAMSELLTRQREPLMRFFSSRLDKRLAARLDVSDIVQDVLVEAACKLPDFFERRPASFTAWLRQIAAERLAHVHRTHIQAKKRSVRREVSQSEKDACGSNGFHLRNARSREKTPSSNVAGQELRDEVARLMQRLPAADQELLRLRFVEQLPAREVAAALGIGPETVRMRQLRALRRLREFLDYESSGEGRK
jgi:RNA polymerase sigma-70 factor (ECF subfamily)